MKKPTIKPLTGSQLREIRLKLGMGHKVFAKHIGVSEGCVKAWQSGTNDVPISYRVTKMLTKHLPKPTRMRFYENNEEEEE